MTTCLAQQSLSLPEEQSFETIRVNLGKRSYNILISSDWLQDFGLVLRNQGIREVETMVFTSPVIGNLYFPRLERALRAAGFVRVIRHDTPDGEENKNWNEYTRCCDALLDAFPESGAIPLVINLGGGVVGDLGGFAAGTFRRGVPYVQIPTTLLGCVDCGVGGKVGVNRGKVKNIMGMFYQPRLVFADLGLLRTLDARQIRSGVAEVIKYGVVCSASLFEFLEEHIEALVALDEDVLNRVVGECYQLKVDVVERDERDEKGIRNVLNFGHTVGHAIEMAAEYRLTHGEAISIGMVAATTIAVAERKCDPSVKDRLVGVLKRAGLPTRCEDPGVTLEAVMESMRTDKKFRGGRNLFVLPVAIGRWEQQEGVPQSLIDDAVGMVLQPVRV